MDFSDALKALKEGKKVRRPCYKHQYLEIITNTDSQKGTSYTLAVFDNPNAFIEHKVSNSDIFVDDWEIVEPQKVPVKTKTVEYITCSQCGKDIDIKNKNTRAICECGTEMVLERSMTLEEAIEKFNGMHFNPKSEFGELSPSPIIKLPSINVNKDVPQGTIKVVSLDPLRTIIEFEYSP